VRDLHEGGIKLPTEVISTIMPLPVVKELFRTDGEQVLKFPPPHVIQGEEFAHTWILEWHFAHTNGIVPYIHKQMQIKLMFFLLNI